MRFIKTMLAVSALMGWTGGGWAACDDPGALSVGHVTATPSGGGKYDPFSDVDLKIDASVLISNGAATACENAQLAFVFATGSPRMSAGSTDGLDVQVIRDGESGPDLLATTLADATRRISVGTIPARSGGADGEVTVNFDVRIAPASAANGVVADGAYRLSPSLIDMVVASTDVDSGNTPLGAKGDLNVSATVDKLLDVNIDGTGYIPGSLAAYTMDLGTLSSGVTGSVGLRLRSNVAHALALSSTNNGRMVGPGANTTHSVPYTIGVGSLSGVDLSSTQTLTYGGKTTRDGAALMLTVTVGDAGDAQAGDYEDTIHVEVSGVP